MMSLLPTVIASTKPAKYKLDIHYANTMTTNGWFSLKISMIRGFESRYLKFYKIYIKIFSIFIDIRIVFRYFKSELKKFRLPSTGTNYR